MGEVLAVAQSLDELIAALRKRVDQLGLSWESLNALCGVLPEHIRPKKQGNSRTLGRMSFGTVLGALGLKLVVVEDRDDALAKVRSRLMARDRDNAHAMGTYTWPPRIKGPADNVFAVCGRAGGYARAAALTPKQRVKISRAAIRARWSKARAG
jgi:hypothetical protein